MPEEIPNFVAQAHAAGGLILIAIGVALVVLAYENWPEKPKWRR